MGLEYFIFYLEASIVCVVILLMIFINDGLYRTRQEKQLCFNRAILAFILYYVSDVGWAGVLSGQLPKTRALVEFFNLSNYILLSVMAYEWFMFMAASEKMAFRRSRKNRLLCTLPIVISTVVMLALYFERPYFWINEAGELNGLYYPLMLAAPVLYLLVAFVLSAINARHAKLREEKKLYWLIGCFPLGVMAFGLLQVASLNAPTFCFGSTVMLLFFYIENTQTLISMDALTRLNNRRQINWYMEQVHYRENTRLYVMMMDIDNFKQINDTYGHAEGDQALIMVSDVLKQSCERMKASAFLGRFGGDEFTIILQNPAESEEPRRLTDTIRASLAEKQQENSLPYPLEVSIGYAELRDKNDTVKGCMERADKRLYLDKRSKGARR